MAASRERSTHRDGPRPDGTSEQVRCDADLSGTAADSAPTLADVERIVATWASKQASQTIRKDGGTISDMKEDGSGPRCLSLPLVRA